MIANMDKKRKEKIAEVSRRLVAFLPAFLLMIMIFCFSAQPSEDSSDVSEFLGTKLFSAANHLFGLGWNLQQITMLSEDAQHVIRKTAHFLEYFALGAALLRGFRINLPADIRRQTQQALKQQFLPALACGLLYAASDELHQFFVPGRSAQIGDVCVDCAGVLTAVLLLGVSGFLRGTEKEKKQPVCFRTECPEGEKQ